MMQDPLDDELVAQEQSVSRERYRTIGVLGGLVVCPIFFAGLFFPNDLHKNLCPLSTFEHGQFTSAGDGWIYGIFGGALAFTVLFSLLISKYLAGKTYPVLIFLSVLGLLASGAAYVNGVEDYFCATPTNIIVRSGYLDTPQSLNWNDVNDVYAWCYMLTGRGQAGYKGGTLRLTFNDGKKIIFGLGNDPQNYKNIKESLKNKTYQYHKDPTVNSNLCPAQLYPLLQDWDMSHE